MSAGAQLLPPSITTELIGWWTAELRGWLSVFRGATEEPSDLSAADLTIGGGRILAGGDQAAFSMDLVSDALQSLQLTRRGRTKGLHLQLEPDRFVTRRLSAGRIPLSRAYRMAELDVSANTPFAVDDVYILFANDEATREGTEYILLRRDIIDPILAAMNARRYRLGRLTLKQSDGMRQVHSYVADGFNRNAGSLFSLLRKRFFLICSLLAVGVLVWNLLSSLDDATAKVNSSIEKVEPAAQKARQSFKKRTEYVSRLRALYQEKEDYTPAAKILEELTRIIPDDTFLTDFALRHQKVQLSGFSTSAASLISIIDASPLFKNPRFTTAVVKVPDRKGEQFSLELELDHAG